MRHGLSPSSPLTLPSHRRIPSTDARSVLRATCARLPRPQQYLSADHAKVMSGNNSQGPIYRVLSAMGHQSESTYKTAPINSFGTEPRLPKVSIRGSHSDEHAPRPPQHITSILAPLSVQPPNRQVPGPGTYKVPSTAYGSQVVSAVSTAPRIVFGSSTRDQAIKVYQEDADKAFFGLGSPGPCAYKTTSMLGRQVGVAGIIARRALASWGFPWRPAAGDRVRWAIGDSTAGAEQQGERGRGQDGQERPVQVRPRAEGAGDPGGRAVLADGGRGEAVPVEQAHHAGGQVRHQHTGPHEEGLHLPGEGPRGVS